MAIQITDQNFSDITNTDQVVLIDFWAEWSFPSRMIGPHVEELSTEYYGKAVIGKVDVDNNPEVSMKFGIRNIPSVIYLKNGQVVDKVVGAVPKAVLEDKLQNLIA
jgi:thioredoxin 1